LLRYITGRVFAALAVLFALSLLCFFIVRLIPGDPVANIINTDSASPEQIAAIREQLGLNRPWPEQYLSWLWGLLIGQMGPSLTQPVMIQELVATRLPVTLELALIGSITSIIVGISLGVTAAIWRNKLPDILIRSLSFVSIAAPLFIVATLVVFLNSITLQLPLLAYRTWEQDPVAHFTSLLVPGLLLGIPMGAFLARYVRNSLLDLLEQDFIRTARAKGASSTRIVFRHALRNCMIPVVTVIGAQFALLVGGTIIIENVFVLPGLGSALISAVNSTDYPVIQTLVIILGAFYVFINLLVDLCYPLIDPRVRLGK